MNYLKLAELRRNEYSATACADCGEPVRDLPREVLARKWGQEYAAQTTYEPCACLRPALEQEKSHA